MEEEEEEWQGKQSTVGPEKGRGKPRRRKRENVAYLYNLLNNDYPNHSAFVSVYDQILIMFFFSCLVWGKH